MTQLFVEPMRVLVIDDNEEVGLVMARMLEAEGARVVVVRSGPEALKLLLHDAMDLVLLDVRMPGWDGPHTLRLLRAAYPELRVVFMTGGTGAYEFDDLLAQGAEAVLWKPIGFPDIARLLTRRSA